MTEYLPPVVAKLTADIGDLLAKVEEAKRALKSLNTDATVKVKVDQSGAARAALAAATRTAKADSQAALSAADKQLLAAERIRQLGLKANRIRAEMLQQDQIAADQTVLRNEQLRQLGIKANKIRDDVNRGAQFIADQNLIAAERIRLLEARANKLRAEQAAGDQYRANQDFLVAERIRQIGVRADKIRADANRASLSAADQELLAAERVKKLQAQADKIRADAAKAIAFDTSSLFKMLSNLNARTGERLQKATSKMGQGTGAANFFGDLARNWGKFAGSVGGITAAVATFGVAAVALQGGLLGITGMVFSAGLGLGSFAALAFPTVQKIITGFSSVRTASINYQDAVSNLNTAIRKSPADYKLYQATIHGLEPDLQNAAKLLTNQNVLWQNLSPSMQKSVAALANNKAALKGLLPDQKAALDALLQQRDAWNNLSPAQQTATRGLQALNTVFQQMVKALAPLTFKVFNDGLRIANILLPYVEGFAKAGGKALDTLLRGFEAFAKSAGFKQFMDQMQKLSGPAIITIGTGLGQIAIALGKLMVALTTPDALKTWKVVFQGIADGITALAAGITLLTKALSALPKGWEKPLLEAGAALLILKKIGVIKLGLKMLGLGGKAAAADTGMWASMLPGVRLIGGALVATLIVDAVLKGTSSGAGKNWLDNPFGQGQFKDPKTGKMEGSPTALTSWQTLGHNIMHYWDMVWQHTVGAAIRGVQSVKNALNKLPSDAMAIFHRYKADVENIWNSIWNNTVGRVIRGVQDVTKWFSNLGPNISNILNGVKGFLENIWNTIWDRTVGRVIRGVQDVRRFFSNLGPDISGILNGVKSFLEDIWNTIWDRTVGRVIRGVQDVIRWFNTLPGGIMGTLASLPGKMFSIGIAILQGLLNGLIAVGGRILSYVSNLASSVWSKFTSLLGIHSPSTRFYQAGQWLMEGLANGILAHQYKVGAAMSGVNNLMGVHPGSYGLSGSVQPAWTASAIGAAGGGAPVIVPVTVMLDGKVLFRATQTQARSYARRNGPPRSANKAFAAG